METMMLGVVVAGGQGRGQVGRGRLSTGGGGGKEWGPPDLSGPPDLLGPCEPTQITHA